MGNTSLNPISKSLYRHLDFDDLSILALMGEGINRSSISTYLYLTPPAICHRLKKYEIIWPDMFKKHRSINVLTEEGFGVCRKAKATVYFLLDLKPTDSYKEFVARGISGTFGRFGNQI